VVTASDESGNYQNPQDAIEMIQIGDSSTDAPTPSEDPTPEQTPTGVSEEVPDPEDVIEMEEDAPED
jgi:hypothetical protein